MYRLIKDNSIISIFAWGILVFFGVGVMLFTNPEVVSGEAPNIETNEIIYNAISDVSKPTNVQASNIVSITAKVEGISTVSLVYKTMFDAEVTIAMHDDGNHQDGAPGDHIFGASIPGQIAGTLVRYKIIATNNDGDWSYPGSDDTTNYLAYVVDDGQTADIPIFRWYMDPVDFDDMTTNHLYDKQKFKAVIAVGDQVIDNVSIRVKGQSSVGYPKRKYKFELPKGYSLGQPAFESPVNEFAIQVYMLNFIDLQEGLMWRTFKEAGFKELQNKYVSVHKNDVSNTSAFYGHYLIIENYDSNWRERNGYSDGALYKEAQEKKTRKNEDNSDIQSLYDNITTLQGQALKDYLMNNLNIPSIINYHAVVAVTSSTDWHFGKNIYEYRDTEGTERWEYLPWDLDNGFLPSMFKEYRSVDFLKNPIINQVASSNVGSEAYYNNSFIEKAMYQFPEFREMFFRRSMNLYDQVWGNDRYMEWFDDLFDKSREAMGDDAVKWNLSKQAVVQAAFPNGLPWSFLDNMPHNLNSMQNPFESIVQSTPQILRDIFIFGSQAHKNDVVAAREQGQLLGSQTSAQESRLRINEIMFNSQYGDSNNYVEIYNDGEDPVDISKWELVGIDFVFASGTVIPGKGYGVIVKNDKAFRSNYPNRFILGEYKGELSRSGQILKLTNTSSKVISQLSYGISSPWSSLPAAEGRSLSLVMGNFGPYTYSCWVPSLTANGTPGLFNDFDQNWINTSSSNCALQTEHNSSGNDNGGNNSNGQSSSNTSSVVTPSSPISGFSLRPVVVTTPTGTNITSSSTVPESSLSNQDESYQYPLGLVSFSFTTNQTDNQVSLTFVTDLKPNQVTARKYNPSTNTYTNLPTSANVSITETTKDNKHALQLTYTITDNGELDLDPTTGIIKDPVGLAVTNATYNQLANTGASQTTMLATVLIGLASIAIAIALVVVSKNRKSYRI